MPRREPAPANGIEWVCFDIAALSLGLVTVPLYVADTPENQAYFLSDSGACLLFIDSEDAWARISAVQGPRLGLNRVVVPSSSNGASRPVDPVRRLSDWLPDNTAKTALAIPDAVDANAEALRLRNDHLLEVTRQRVAALEPEFCKRGLIEQGDVVPHRPVFCRRVLEPILSAIAVFVFRLDGFRRVPVRALPAEGLAMTSARSDEPVSVNLA